MAGVKAFDPGAGPVIADIAYGHFDDSVPTKDILDSFKKQKEMDSADYERRLNALMEQRSRDTQDLPNRFDQAWLLCSEATPENCHRRLLAEHVGRRWGDAEIKHL